MDTDVKEHYLDAVKVGLVMGNLNTHDTASLNATFKPAEARRLTDQPDILYITKTRQLAQHHEDRI